MRTLGPMKQTIRVSLGVTSRYCTCIQSNQRETQFERRSCGSLRALAQKKSKVGRPKLPKGTAKGRIVPVRFADDEIKAMVRASRAANQTMSEWLRALARFGTTMQPPIFIECPECRSLAAKTLAIPMCDSCKARH